MLVETHFSKYQYIINIRHDPLDITKKIIYFVLKYSPGGTNSHQESIISESTKFSNDIF